MSSAANTTHITPLVSEKRKKTLSNSLTVRDLRADFRALGDETDIENLARFFKTREGEYGAGDRFLGIRVPAIRKAVRRYRAASERTTISLLKSVFHEERLLAALMLVDRFERGDVEMRGRIYTAYMSNRAGLNNWDIIDSSAHKIVGPWLADKNRDPLYELAVSSSLWDRRIAMIATYHYIRENEFTDALKIAAILRDDDEDLIQKAAGWMLREVGNRNLRAEERFLEKYYSDMPRTMLRYAIEKFPQCRRRAYLNGDV